MGHYLIYQVHHNSKHTHIEKVKTYRDDGFNLTSPEEQARTTGILNLKASYTYKTIYKNVEGKYTMGEDVRIIKVGSEEFIRTDTNTKASDNLGNLPEH